MIDGRHILRKIIDGSELREGTPRLNGARSGVRIIEGIRAVQMRCVVTNVIYFEHSIPRQLLLDADVPMLIRSALQMRVSRIHAGIHARTAKRLPQKEVSKRPVRNGVGRVEYGLA